MEAESVARRAAGAIGWRFGSPDGASPDFMVCDLHHAYAKKTDATALDQPPIRPDGRSGSAVSWGGRRAAFRHISEGA